MSLVYVFDAKLVDHFGALAKPKVTRRLALPGTQTLSALHLLIQEALSWEDDHLFAFWLDGKFWSREEPSYQPPFELDEMGAKSARVRLDKLGLDKGQRIAYLFDFGDEWRVLLTVREIREGGETGILAAEGEAPPQYPDWDEEE